MKITFFCIKFPLASETFVLKQIISFINLGHDVDIVSLYPGDNEKLHAEYLHYGIENKTTYLFDNEKPESKNKKEMILYRLVSILNKIYKPVVWKSLNFLKYGKYTYKLFLPSIVSRIDKKIKSDIIVAHFGPCGVIADMLRDVGVLTGKLATIFHGYDISTKEVLDNYRHDYKKLFKSGDYFFPISNLWKEKLISLGCPDGKVKVIRMGIETQNFKFSPKKINNKKLQFVSVCRLTEKKGLEYAIKACAILKAQKVCFQYIIVGFGELEKNLRILINELKLSDCVEIVGFKPQEEVKNILTNSDVFVLPSITADNGDMEGIPVALMEAMAVGLAVVSTYHSGIPELIDNNVTGWLCEEKNEVELAKILTFFSRPQNEFDKIILAARKKIESSFEQSIECAKMASILESK